MEQELIWQNIVAHEGQIFTKILGREFTYTVHGEAIQVVGNQPYPVSRQNIINAHAIGQVKGPGAYPDHIVGPSYVWALLHDERINVW